ncbi:DUF2787 family protein [Vibrio sp. M250220]|uniref:DUF2787 family protein n=1 Tax=Vibrio sp. M250220 TaxID=3020894 RepID=UPI002F42ECFB
MKTLMGLQLNVPMSLTECLHRLVEQLSLPCRAHRISLNFRHTPYYATRTGPKPVEVRLEKVEGSWRLVFLASFAYASEDNECVSPEYYFNTKCGWYYQMNGDEDILTQAVIQTTLDEWSRQWCRDYLSGRFDDISAQGIRANSL